MSKTNLPTVDRTAAFVAKMKAVSTLPRNAKTSASARLIVAMDATASRGPSWETARSVMDSMFREVPDGLAVQVVWYDGHGFHQSAWSSDAKSLVDAISRVECSPGKTKIFKVLEHACDATKYDKISGLVFVGDVCEEPLDALQVASRRLRLLGCPVFVFQEGMDANARAAFRSIADITGGALVPFDNNAPQKLRDILAGVAAYAKGGMKALEATTKRLPGATALLTQMKGE